MTSGANSADGIDAGPDDADAGTAVRNPAGGRPLFRLRRFFSLASFAGVAVVVAGLLLFNRHLAFRTLVTHETRNNAALTRFFANAIWSEHPGYLEKTGRTGGQPLQGPAYERLRAALLQRMQGLNIVKIKIYDLDGLTIFSTDPKQMGENREDNPGFTRAKAGQTVSQMVFKERFDAFEQVINDRNLMSSYIPIRQGPDSPVEGVVEVYSDVSELVGEIDRTQWEIAFAVFGSLSLLYLFLGLVVRQADRIITDQYDVERLANQEKLHRMAFRDHLTGLPNRANFAERLDLAIRQARRTGRMFAILFIDLDHFKYINDSLGHVTGDRLLKAVGARLSGCLRESDMVARLGGDEFIVLLPEVDNIEQTAQVAEKLCTAIAGEPYELDARELRIHASIGIGIYPDDGEDSVELIKNADIAMYHAKETGRNNYQFFTQDMNAKAFAVLSMEQDLRRALERSEFVLHYQPQLDIAGRVVGMEALIRWQHPEFGLVPPGNFIAIAEERGLIVPIGNWVLKEACRQNRAWQAAGLPKLHMAINVSALQFRQRDFPDKVADVLAETGLSPGCLELEITESAIMHDAEAAIATVRRLKAMGVKLSIDDFGTGYSSLSYLKRFPIDRLKLDQSFVRGIPADSKDMAISSAVLGLARALKLKVVAEGVETLEQLDFLRQQECDEVQGFYFSKPLAPEDFFRFAGSREPSGAGRAGGGA